MFLSIYVVEIVDISCLLCKSSPSLSYRYKTCSGIPPALHMLLHSNNRRVIEVITSIVLSETIHRVPEKTSAIIGFEQGRYFAPLLCSSFG